MQIKMGDGEALTERVRRAVREWTETRPDQLDEDDVREMFASWFGRAPTAADGDVGTLYSLLCAEVQS